jgi:hypothetical protein
MTPRQQRAGVLPNLMVAALCAVGAAARLVPLVDRSGRLLQQFPTEDGYLMMTIARSISLGRGMSTGDGLIASNGTQPAFSGIEALCFWLVGGDRSAGVFAIELVQFLVSMAAGWALFALGRRILRERSWGRSAAALAAATWFASSNVVPHTMNCLETGWYTLMVLLSVLSWHKLWVAAESSAAVAMAKPGSARRSRNAGRDGNPSRVSISTLWPALGAGAILGLTLWARIDAVFLLAALTVVHAGAAYRDGWDKQRLRLVESAVAGAVAVAMIAPWLIYGKLRFGSFMPISGQAESGDRWFANAALLPASLFRYITLVLPVPHQHSDRLSVIVVCSVVALAWVAILVRAAGRATPPERWLLAAGTLLTLGFCGYYGLVFGAGHFLDRYLFPASPFIALATVALLAALASRVARWRWTGVVLWTTSGAFLAALLALHGRAYRDGARHMHFQVVDWVRKNVAETSWVAAVQTGTLGFFHDRTVNLDGKVNPEALALLKQRRIPDYVASSRWGKEQASIDYLADWEGIAEWSSHVPVRSNFDLIVDDSRLNLAVFRRKNAAAYSLR